MILAINKIDCVSSASTEFIKNHEANFDKHVNTSAVTGQGISDLERAIVDIMGLDIIPTGGRRWTVNQVRSFIHLGFELIHVCIRNYVFFVINLT